MIFCIAVGTGGLFLVLLSSNNDLTLVDMFLLER